MFKSKHCSGGGGCLGGVLGRSGQDDIRDWDPGQEPQGKERMPKPSLACLVAFLWAVSHLERKNK